MEQYVITNGAKFVRQNINNKYEFTSNLAMADTYTCSTANHILKNCIGKSRAVGFGIAKLENGEVGAIANPQKYSVRKNGNRNRKEAKTNTAATPKKEYAVSVDNQYSELGGASLEWLEKFENLKDLRTKAIERERALCETLEMIERFECDTLHYIEFNKLNCRDGYKAYSVLQKLLKKRRAIKDELDIVQYTLEQYTDDTEKSINRLIARIEGKKERRYGVRAFKELFDGGVNDTSVGERLDALLSDCL